MRLADSRARLRKLVSGRGAQQALSPLSASLLAPIEPQDPTAPAGPTVVLLDDCRDQINFGALALVDGLIRLIQESIPNVSITPIPSHWLMDTSSGWEAFVASGAGLSQPWAPFPDLADQFVPVADQWMSGDAGEGAQHFLGRFAGADLVVLNGEGSLYRTNQSAIRELFLAWLAKTRLDIPTVFANGMVHLNDVVPILPAMARKTFGAIDGVAVREPYSLRNLQEHVPGVRGELFPDSAFVITADEATETAAVRDVLSRVGQSPYFCFDPGAMPMDHRFPKRSGLYELIRRLKTVVPQAVLVNSSPADGYIRQIAAETDSIYVDTIETFREYLALVRGAQFVATGRYHNPILAAIVGTPSITFASANHKVHGASELLQSAPPFDGTDLLSCLDDIEAQARSLVASRDAVRTRLLARSDRLRSEAKSLGVFLADRVRSRTP